MHLTLSLHIIYTKTHKFERIIFLLLTPNLFLYEKTFRPTFTSKLLLPNDHIFWTYIFFSKNKEKYIHSSWKLLIEVQSDIHKYFFFGLGIHKV